jgi:hypothetical protein
MESHVGRGVGVSILKEKNTSKKTYDVISFSKTFQTYIFATLVKT